MLLHILIELIFTNLQLKTDFGYSDAELGFLFSIYSLPNILAVFIAGILVDWLGVKACCLLCTALFTTGYLITLGESFFFLVLGRAIYGLGSECISGWHCPLQLLHLCSFFTSSCISYLNPI